MYNIKEKFICPEPFNYFEVDSKGKVWVCCEDWLSTPIGNLNENSISEIWNSQIAIEIRKSIYEGSYLYCNKDTCPKLVQKSFKVNRLINDSYFKDIVKYKKVYLEKGPRIFNLSYDNTCNLKCMTCRPSIISLKNEELEKAEKLQRKILDEGLFDAKQIIITGQGDPFASKLYNQLLRTLDAKKYPKLTICIMTNGLLLTPGMWKSMKKIQHAIECISISIDAVKEDTYKTIRGGDFKKLLSNLKFISKLARKKKIGSFEITFVVQKINYKEMEEFIRMGMKLKCDKILFQQLMQWKSVMNSKEYEMAAIHIESHPEYNEFKKILQNSIFKIPIVDMSNLEYLIE